MARARNIKPGFFTNDALADASPLARILFAGLWCFADREGRMHDRPKKIKAEILPYDQCDAEELLESLKSLGFIIRYEVDGAKFIQVLNFDKHQNPHVKEQASEIPAPCNTGASPMQGQNNPEVAGLIPSSLIPSTLTLSSDSLFLDSGEEQKTLPPGKPTGPKKTPPDETNLQSACKATFKAYQTAYAGKYGTPHIDNQRVRSQIKQFVRRVGFEESPLVAAWFVGHPSSFYVQKMHGVGLLLADAEKLRTEWCTGVVMTQTKAQQSDRTQSNFNAANEAIRMLQAEGIA